MAKEKIASPDAAQMAALRDYAAKNGRHWKTKLLNDWMSCRLRGDIHRLRNTHGPSWLVKYKLDDAA